MAFKITYKPFGERSILIEWPTVINDEIINEIIQFKRIIEYSNVKSIIELKTAYNSLLVVYCAICKNFKNEVFWLQNLYETMEIHDDKVSVLWKIPVCYDAVFGIDLDVISQEKRMSKEAVIKLHSNAVYTVYFIGFLPGFLYLGGLNASINMPRKATPRLKIERGAVAIGGSQTGVYPSESPGGWNVIGNSPVLFFNPQLDEPCFAKAGDRIRFQPVSLQEHETIKFLVEAGDYYIENEVFYG